MDFAKLKQMLIHHEGFKLKPYVDTVGKVTIGVGHNLTDLGLTSGQVMGILDDDITNTMTFLTHRCPWFAKLDDVRARAIADMAFNLMEKLLGFKSMIAAIEAQDWFKAANELRDSQFAHQVGARAQELATMIETGKDA